jgi:hypothetical protein
MNINWITIHQPVLVTRVERTADGGTVIDISNDDSGKITIFMTLEDTDKFINSLLTAYRKIYGNGDNNLRVEEFLKKEA